ncbi:ParB/RepB/Spo0J family partition protein [Citreicella sp. C3M06]|uniref:ParB/RepB/Spo0J family partition protein n=1 Tax=Citreicella sp. C3M06 TaxID=2841564 RepID=UPI001C08F674|nr:ParB/RepB/Spo0J family partition protein [Citreicella sp. C3M06]MBU2961051.1 ParB/RepB/Spo0J family partition protein [Citreicella sp. C3M06]
MARRRKLEAPSADELQRLEAEFTAGPVGRAAPIAQVAGEAAAGHDPRPAEARETAARDRVDAQAHRDAKDRGLLLLDIPLGEIEADALVRDRVVMDHEEMEELKASISRNGLRLPIEVFERAGQGPKWGLLSGYRRLHAMRALHAMTQLEAHASIKAIVRDPAAMGGTFAAMIEENEIRSALSPYERGRIAVIAAQQGAFGSTEEAVATLFPQASKAKRSKIRSFALIFEELGDMLTFPDLIKEKDGLALATALRGGAETRLREVLAERVPETPAQEAQLIADALADLEPAPEPRRGGRPKAAPKLVRRVQTDSGVSLQSGEDAQGWFIRLKGGRVDRELVEVLMSEMERLLGDPD